MHACCVNVMVIFFNEKAFEQYIPSESLSSSALGREKKWNYFQSQLIIDVLYIEMDEIKNKNMGSIEMRTQRQFCQCPIWL